MERGSYTSNYSLLKPAREDFYDVTDFNQNADTIDTVLKALADKDISLENLIDALAAVAKSGSYEDLTNKPTSMAANGGNSDTVDNKHAKEIGLSYIADAYTEYIGANNSYGWTSLDDIKSSGKFLISVHSGLSNMPDNQSGFLQVIAQSGNRAKQTWYNTTNSNIYHRYCSGGAWGDWVRINDGGNAETLQGKAPDAFAPSGFGLGTKCTYLENVDLNDVSGTGFFMFAIGDDDSNGMKNYPVADDYVGWWYLIQMQHSDNYKKQIATILQGGSDRNKIYIRNSDGGAWNDWSVVGNGFKCKYEGDAILTD